MTVRALVLRGPGSNCDRETEHALTMAGAEPVRVHVRALIEDPSMLDGAGILAVPGGFTYGDDISAGRVFANAMASHLGGRIRRFVDEGGVVIGICNGFQILVKLGLLPGDEEGVQTATLTDNDSDRFECRWVRLKVTGSKCPLLEDGAEMELPVAHREGKFVVSAERLAQLEADGQLVLRYASSEYPENPNGSHGDVAGICDPTGRVFGLMPHPERYVRRQQHPRWTRGEGRDPGDGLGIFRKAVALVGAPASLSQ